MQIHQLKHKLRKSKRIGRGGKRGTYSGRGLKGQRARSGHKIRPAIRELIIRLPKRRGYKFKSIQPKMMTINLALIERSYQTGETVNLVSLQAKKLLDRSKSKPIKTAKILGRGSLTKKLLFEGPLQFSGSAKAAIEKSGSTIKPLDSVQRRSAK